MFCKNLEKKKRQKSTRKAAKMAKAGNSECCDKFHHYRGKTQDKQQKECHDISQLCREKEHNKCQHNIVATFGNMSQQKMSRNPEKTLELCRYRSIDCRDKTKGRMKKECLDIAKFVEKKARRSSQKFVVIIVFMSCQNLPRSAVHGKERMSRHYQILS